MSNEAATDRIGSNLRQAEVGRNARIFGLARLIPVIVLAGVAIPLAGRLGPARFGEFTVVGTVSSVSLTLVDGGLTNVAVRRVARDVRVRPSVHGELVTSRVLVAVGAIVLQSLVLVALLGATREVAVLTSLAAVQVLSGSLSGSYQMYAQFEPSLTPYAIRDLIGRLVPAGIAVLGLVVARGSSLLAIVTLGLALGPCVSGVLFRFHFRAGRLRPVMGTISGAGRLLRESWPIALATGINTVYFRLDTFLLAWLASRVQVGEYGVAYRLLEVFLLMGSMYQTAYFRVAAGVRHSSLVQLMVESWRRAAWVGFPLAAVGSTLGEIAVPYVLGERYKEVAVLLPILFLGGAVTWLNSIGGATFVAAGQERRTLLINVAVVIVNLISNLALIPVDGSVGAAWANMASECLATCMMIVFARRLLGLCFGKISRSDLWLGGVVLASVACCALEVR